MKKYLFESENKKEYFIISSSDIDHAIGVAKELYGFEKIKDWSYREVKDYPEKKRSLH